MHRSTANVRLIGSALIALLGLTAVAEAQTAPPPPTEVDAGRGGLTVSSGVNSLTIGARAQFRWTLDDRDADGEDPSGDDLSALGKPFSQFDIPRMRVSFSGGAFRPWLRYAFQFDFSRTSGESASKIKDATIEIRPTGQPLRLVVGQFKVPFGLQQLTSSGRLEFVDRAITDSKFNPSRDMGVMVAGTVRRFKLGLEGGVFNGAGESVRQNNRSHLFAGRVYVQPLGVYALSEGASDAVAAPVLHFGAGARTGKQIRGRTAAGVLDRADNQTAFNLEAALKTNRLFATGEYFWATDEQENPSPDRDIRSRGFHAQAGYMLLPRRLEVGALGARITGDTETGDADLTELRAVVGYYWQGHGLKLQGDVGRLEFDANYAALPSRARQGLPGLGSRAISGQRLADTQIRVQLQLAF